MRGPDPRSHDEIAYRKSYGENRGAASWIAGAIAAPGPASGRARCCREPAGLGLARCLVPGSADRGTEKPLVERREAPFRRNGKGTPRPCAGRLRQPPRRSRKPPRFPALRSPCSGSVFKRPANPAPDKKQGRRSIGCLKSNLMCEIARQTRFTLSPCGRGWVARSESAARAG